MKKYNAPTLDYIELKAEESIASSGSKCTSSIDSFDETTGITIKCQ